MKLKEEDFAIVQGLLLGAMNGYNEKLEKGHYFSISEMEVFDKVRSLLNRMEQSE